MGARGDRCKLNVGMSEQELNEDFAGISGRTNNTDFHNIRDSEFEKKRSHEKTGIKKADRCKTGPLKLREAARLTFRKLETFAGARLTGLFAFFFARIAGQMTSLLQRNAQFWIELLKCAGNTMSYGHSLTGNTTAVNISGHVYLVAHLNREERSISLLRKILVREVRVEVTTVGRILARTFSDAHPCGGSLATTSGRVNVCFSAHDLIRGLFGRGFEPRAYG